MSNTLCETETSASMAGVSCGLGCATLCVKPKKARSHTRGRVWVQRWCCSRLYKSLQYATDHSFMHLLRAAPSDTNAPCARSAPPAPSPLILQLSPGIRSRLFFSLPLPCTDFHSRSFWKKNNLKAHDARWRRQRVQLRTKVSASTLS